jgi:hypothetical protein
MALTQDTSANAIPRNDKSADRLRKTIKITGPVSYITGGITVEPGPSLGMGDVHMICGNVMRSNADGGLSIRLVALNRDTLTNIRLQWYDLAGAEIANAVNLSTFSGEIEFIGNG